MPSRRTVVAGGAALIAGCLSPEPDDPNPENHVPDKWHDEPKQALADPIVRTAQRDSNLEDECPYAVADVISELLRTRLEDPKNTHVSGGAVESGLEEPGIVVYRRLSISRDGNVVSSPNISFQAIREALPEYVLMTVASDYAEHTCRYAVFVRDLETHEA
jgi:hypothetical protein